MSIREIQTYELFKSSLSQNKPKCSPLFYIGPRYEAIQLARLRMNCSTLNKDLYKFGILQSSLCDCGTGVEDIYHFFFVCPRYVVPRNKLQTTVIQYASFTMRTLLHGSSDCDDEHNHVIVSSVLDYISQTGRFGRRH
jgi:hypothetical protein